MFSVKGQIGYSFNSAMRSVTYSYFLFSLLHPFKEMYKLFIAKGVPLLTPSLDCYFKVTNFPSIWALVTKLHT